MSGGDPTSIKARGVVPPPALSAQCAEPSQGGSIAAAESDRGHGSDGGGSITPEPAATLIHRKRAGAGHPAALRCVAPGAFWEDVARGAIRLTPPKDRKCLRCSATFQSTGPGNRMCHYCRTLPASPYEPDWGRSNSRRSAARRGA